MKNPEAFGEDWRRTRGIARKALTLHIAPVFDAAAVARLNDATWDAMLAAALADLESWRKAGRFGAGDAISLLGDAAILRNNIVDAGPALVSDTAARVRGSVLARSLGRMRAAMVNEDSYRRQLWNRIDRISRDLDASEGYQGNRCNVAHWRKLAAKIVADFPGDRKLYRKIDSLADLFYEFCEDCRQSWSFIDEDSIEAEDVRELPDLKHYDYHLEDCIEELEETSATFVRVHYRLGDVVHLSSKAWCDSNGVDNTRFHRTLGKARLALAECLERQLTAAGQD